MKSVYRKRNSLWTILISVSLVVLVAFGVRYYLQTILPPSQTMTYLTHGSPTSQWLVLSASQPPMSVTANNTGLIQQFQSSGSLNATKIGVYCVRTVTSESATGLGGNSTVGACAQFTAYQQTGWYWDQKSGLLFIHYLGGPNVQIRIAVRRSTASST